MDKRYQVFVSSTFADLKEERQAVMQALLSLDHFPAGMELFPASDDDALTLIKGVIDDSDYYVLVIGGRYGSTNAEGLGYTEMEFDYARAEGKPILAFIHEIPEQIAAGKTDQNDALREKLGNFRRKVEAGHHVKFWRNPDDLKAKVIQAISAEPRRNPQEGWVRASRASDPFITEQLRQQIDTLQQQLEAARDTPPKGSDQYAGGSDSFAVRINYQMPPTSFERSGTAVVTVTWDEIFYEVGPMMFEEATEVQMRSRLTDELWLYQGLENRPTNGPRSKNVLNESFETIKVQLLALGLIRRSDRKHAPLARLCTFQVV
jgi:hypothetical protein